MLLYYLTIYMYFKGKRQVLPACRAAGAVNWLVEKKKEIRVVNITTTISSFLSNS